MRSNECEDVEGSGAKSLTFRVSKHDADDQSWSVQRFDLFGGVSVIILAIDGLSNRSLRHGTRSSV